MAARVLSALTREAAQRTFGRRVAGVLRAMVADCATEAPGLRRDARDCSSREYDTTARRGGEFERQAGEVGDGRGNR